MLVIHSDDITEQQSAVDVDCGRFLTEFGAINSFLTITGIFRLRQASLHDRYRNFPVSWVHSLTEAVSTISQLDTLLKELLPLLYTSANTCEFRKENVAENVFFLKAETSEF